MTVCQWLGYLYRLVFKAKTKKFGMSSSNLMNFNMYLSFSQNVNQIYIHDIPWMTTFENLNLKKWSLEQVKPLVQRNG